MIKRDFDLNIEEKKKVIIKKEIKKKKEYEPLSRVLIIGPNYPERCHFSENIYDLWQEREEYDIRIVADLELPVNSMHVEKGLELPLSTIVNTLESWKPQLIIVDQININFMNDQVIPVFYHHRNYFRDPAVFYPTLVWFWHENILRYYKNWFKRNWMAQVQYHDISYVPYNPNLFQSNIKKKYKGVNGIGFREPPEFAEEIDDMFEIAPVKILAQEWNRFKELGFHVFDTPVTDEEYREYIPQCEAVWIRLSTRQYTSRFMVEAMGCKTLCVIKLENRHHEQILEKMGLFKDIHYLGVNKLEDIKEVYNTCKNKEEIIKKAYNVVINNHTYNNRIDQIIKTYEAVINKKL